MDDREIHTELTQQAVRKQAVIWLSRIDRGLRPDEVASLRAWLGVPAHRECILTTARLWHGPETVSVLAALFPVDAEPTRRTRARPVLMILATMAVAAAIVTIATLAINSTFEAAGLPAHLSQAGDGNSP